MIEIFFITSNRAKLEHAKYWCKGYNLSIKRQKQYGVGYIEPRFTERSKLLDESINDAVNRLKKVTNNFENLFVMIEDTSVVIDAISTDDNEVPGLDIKYWMEKTSFSDLDKLLKQNGNNRSASVRSDIILFLPRILQNKLGTKYFHFISSTEGKITEKEFNINTQELYPWLSGQTFNKWFVPKGETKPLSLLSIEKANKHDFRKGAFHDLLDFLTKEKLIKYQPNSTPNYRQLNLFNLNLFIICGFTCAGKTTIADFLTTNYGFYHVEASDFMYLSYYEKHGPFSDVRIGDFARKALLDNPTIVSDQIVAHLSEFQKVASFPIVISGFRDPEEIKGFKRKYSGKLDILELFVDADIQKRFKRCIFRGRDEKIKTFGDFKKVNKQQEDMGLLKIKDQIDNINIILNDKSISAYCTQFEERYVESKQYLIKKKALVLKEIFTEKNLPKKLEHHILIAMSQKKGTFLTTTEITKLVNSLFKFEKIKEKDNISRYFNYKYRPYYEISVENQKLRYRLSQTGFSYSQLLIQSYLR